MNGKRHLECVVCTIVVVAWPAALRADISTHYGYSDAGLITREYVEDTATAEVLSETRTRHDNLGRAWYVRRLANPGGTVDDALDGVTTTAYDWVGNERAMASYLETGNIVITYEYDFASRRTKMTDAETGETTYRYDGRGNVITMVNPIGNRTDYGFGAIGQQIVELRYDELGQLVLRVQSDFDSRGNRIRERSYDCSGIALMQKRWTYDESGWLSGEALMANAASDTLVSTSVDRIIDYVYDDGGRCLTSKSYNMGSTTPLPTAYEYDAIGRLTKTTIPGGWSVTTFYDDTTGRITLRTADDHPGHAALATDYAYDQFGRLTTETVAGARVTRYTYDGLGRRTTMEDPNGHVTKYEYDGMGRRTLVTEDLGELNRITGLLYDRAGRLASVIAHDAANAQTTRYWYDGVGRRTKIGYPDRVNETTDVVALDYDPAGRMTGKIDQRGIVTTYTYNGQDLLKTRTSTDGAIIADTYEYDGLGRMTVATRTVDGNEIARNTFEYDDLACLTRETQQVFGGGVMTVQYWYDQAGNRTRVMYPHVDVALKYTYDSLNRVDVVSRGVGGASAVTLVDYDYTGKYVDARRILTTSPGLVVETGYTWNADRRSEAIVNRWRDQGVPEIMGQFDYLYDLVGNRTSAVGSGDSAYVESMTYGYDGLHRLTSATYGPSVAETFNYDSLGNREGTGNPFGYSDSRPGGADIAYAPNSAANEYTYIDGATTLYDEAGNLIQDESGLKYEYDAENHLVRISRD